jgi:hypothetical protein
MQIILRMIESILLAVFFGASGAIAKRRNSNIFLPSRILFCATGLDQIATAKYLFADSATKQILCVFLTTFDQ